MQNPTILVVEDDDIVRNLIVSTLEEQSYNYLTEATGNAAILTAGSENPDVILLDLGLPDIDGVEVIKRVRSWSNIPIIVVSARSDDKDKIDALDAGADDYLTKPFSVDELLARLRVSLRREAHDCCLENDGVFFINGDLKIDFSAGSVYISGNKVHLTPIEYKLLCLLSKNIGRVLTHNYILRDVWGNAQESDVPSLRVFMATLRKKIETDTTHPRYIQTHIGIGYCMLRVSEKDNSENITKAPIKLDKYEGDLI